MAVTRTLRFVIGAALVAGGIQLVGPLALKLIAVGRSAPVDAGPGRAALVPPTPANSAPLSAAPAAPQAVMPPAAIGLEPPGFSWSDPLATQPPDSGGGLQWDRSPPPPPAPLPAVPQELAQATPAFGAAYRSTLRVPPPDLLDAAAPPPRGPWGAPDPALPDHAPAAPSEAGVIPQAAGGGDLTVPATYRIADGDDLERIAGRFYGHPAAASAIWAANRHVIPDPALLPIGVELRLPPPWAAAPHRHAANGAIEPAAYARPVGPAAGPDGSVGSARATWLAPAPAPPPPAVFGGSSGTVSPGVAATSVQVGPGETLTTLAQRLYGDPAAAAEIFAVNRDRLRSPELVVAGMELRLPRPVTAPRS